MTVIFMVFINAVLFPSIFNGFVIFVTLRTLTVLEEFLLYVLSNLNSFQQIFSILNLMCGKHFKTPVAGFVR